MGGANLLILDKKVLAFDARLELLKGLLQFDVVLLVVAFEGLDVLSECLLVFGGLLKAAIEEGIVVFDLGLQRV